MGRGCQCQDLCTHAWQPSPPLPTGEVSRVFRKLLHARGLVSRPPPPPRPQTGTPCVTETVSWSDHDLQQTTNTRVSLGPHGDQAEGENKTLLVLLVSRGCHMYVKYGLLWSEQLEFKFHRTFCVCSGPRGSKGEGSGLSQKGREHRLGSRLAFPAP